MKEDKVCNDDIRPVVRLFRDEFSEDAWIAYCVILGINEEMANRIISVELEVSRVLPQIN